jgi:thiol-disulfide isomerase/thioredoxin
MNQSKRVFVRIGVMVAAAGLGALVLNYTSYQPPTRLSAPGGYSLPEFRLPILDAGFFEGDTTFLASEDIRGRVTLVTFWASWCLPCIAEQPSPMALHDEFGASGLQVFGVLHRDSPITAFEWLQENDRLGLQSVIGTAEFARDSRGGALPQTLLVDRNGQVTEVFFGYWEEREHYLRERVADLLES